MLRRRAAEPEPERPIYLTAADWCTLRDLVVAEQARTGDSVRAYSALGDLLVRVESHIPPDEEEEGFSLRSMAARLASVPDRVTGTGHETTRSLEAEQRRAAEERKARERGH